MEMSLGRGRDVPGAIRICQGTGCRVDVCWSSQLSGEAQHCYKPVPDGSQTCLERFLRVLPCPNGPKVCKPHRTTTTQPREGHPVPPFQYGHPMGFEGNPTMPRMSLTASSPELVAQSQEGEEGQGLGFFFCCCCCCLVKMALQATFTPLGVFRRYHGLSSRLRTHCWSRERVGVGASGHQAKSEQSTDELNCCIRGTVAKSREIVYPHDQQWGNHLPVSQGKGRLRWELLSAGAAWEQLQGNITQHISVMPNYIT